LREVSVLKLLLAPFSWREVARCNHWLYQQNTATGERRVKRIPRPRGWMAAPYDIGWVEQGLEFGEWRRLHPPPPMHG
jgi:hypothetical protein